MTTNLWVAVTALATAVIAITGAVALLLSLSLDSSSNSTRESASEASLTGAFTLSDNYSPVSLGNDHGEVRAISGDLTISDTGSAIWNLEIRQVLDPYPDLPPLTVHCVGNVDFGKGQVVPSFNYGVASASQPEESGMDWPTMWAVVDAYCGLVAYSSDIRPFSFDLARTNSDTVVLQLTGRAAMYWIRNTD